MRRLLQIIGRVVRLSGAALLAPVILLSPRNRKKIVFGAWMGTQYSCNPKYLFEYMLKAGEFTCVWIGDARLKPLVRAVPGARFAAKGSIAALYHALTARFYVSNVNWREDIMNIPRCRRVNLLYLTHGYADKNVGIKQFAGAGEKKSSGARLQGLRNLLNVLEDKLYGFGSWCSESSERGVQIRLTNQPFIMSEQKILRFGKPRADYFIANAHNVEERRRQKEKYAKLLGIPVEKKWYVFVPTWRHGFDKFFSFLNASQRDMIDTILDAQNAVIIEKQHPLMLRKMDRKTSFDGRVCFVAEELARQIDAQELLMASDRLITDYSSVYFDFVLMNRPVIHFAYDFDHYMNEDMGFNYDMREFGGGPFAYTEDELLSVMKLSDEDLLARKGAQVMSHLSYERGASCAGYLGLLRKLSADSHYFVS